MSPALSGSLEIRRFYAVRMSPVLSGSLEIQRFYAVRMSPALSGSLEIWRFYAVRMSPALSGGLEVQCFERIELINICNRIILGFCLGLPHTASLLSKCDCIPTVSGEAIPPPGSDGPAMTPNLESFTPAVIFSPYQAKLVSVNGRTWSSTRLWFIGSEVSSSSPGPAGSTVVSFPTHERWYSVFVHMHNIHAGLLGVALLNVYCTCKL